MASRGRKLTRRMSAKGQSGVTVLQIPSLKSRRLLVVSPAASTMPMHAAQSAHRDDRKSFLERQTEPFMHWDLALVNRKFHE